MTEKPSYIGMLNAISNGERGGHELLSAWAAVTPDEQIRGMLNMVAIREAEHAWAFEKRLCELGYGLRKKEPDAGHAKRMACVRSNAKDCEKFVELGYAREPDPNAEDGLLKLLADKSIDPQTGALLGRFIAEERDSGRVLRAACQRAHEIAGVGGNAMQQDVLGQVCAQLAELNKRVDMLSKQIPPVRAVG